jgi:hypothetical protein
MGRGQHLTALEILDVQLQRTPGNAELAALAVQAAEGHLEFLLRQRTQKDALAWLRGAIENRPTLEPLRKRIPALDAHVTLNELFRTHRGRDPYWIEARKFCDRYPTNPDAPYIAKRVAEKQLVPWAGLYFYEMAIDRGKYKGDPHIFKTISRIFREYDPQGRAAYAHELARKHFDAQRTAWARKALDEEPGLAILNAWSILEEKKDPALADPFYRALKAVVEKRDLDAACKTLTAVEDAKRGARARSIVQEVIDKGKLKAPEEEVLLPAMDALIKKWGAPPAAPEKP